MGIYVKRNNRYERYVDHVKGYIKPGQVFAARFQLPDSLSVDQLQKLPGGYYLDDVQAVR
jgi:hypothetical protein